MTSRQIIQDVSSEDVRRVLANNSNARYIGEVNDVGVIINRAALIAVTS